MTRPTQWLATALCAALVTALGAGRPASAVVLDADNKLTVTLSDGAQVELYGQAAERHGQKTSDYYSLPTNLHLSARPDGTPEFLFLKFTTEQREDQGGVSGALMHFLMEWGLTPGQVAELTEKLEKEHGGAKYMGVVEMEPVEAAGSFQIVSATLGDSSLAPSVVTSGKAPLVPGGKAAVATRLQKNGAQLLAASFEDSKSITDVSLAMDFMYTVQIPAAKGHIVFDWSKYEKEYDSIAAEYKKKNKVDWGTVLAGAAIGSVPGAAIAYLAQDKTKSQSYTEMRSHYDFLIEKQIVRLEWDETVSDERVNTIRDAFFQYFLNTFTETTPPAEGEAAKPLSETAKLAQPKMNYEKNYKFKQTFVSRSLKQKVQRFDLSMRLAMKRPFQLVGNLGSWYDHVKDNPKCVASVNLNDPFFQHRDIHFILDLDAKEMFDDAVNYVTISVRKKRSDGNPFRDHVTIDKKFLEKNGVTATVTYARGEDRDSDVYEYQSQWSLRGGELFPADPPWQRGSWEGVTLAPPVVARTLEVEADIADLNASNITRATMVIRYPQFGKEKEERIHVSAAAGQPSAKKTLFMDRDARGYAYQLILNHKTEGKLATGWQASLNDDYLFASVPENLIESQTAMDAAKKAARALVEAAKEPVLEQFKHLFTGAGGN